MSRRRRLSAPPAPQLARPKIAPAIADKRKQRRHGRCAVSRLSRHPLIHRRIAAKSHTFARSSAASADPRQRHRLPKPGGLVVNFGELKGAIHVRSFDRMERAAPPGDLPLRTCSTTWRSSRRRASGRRELRDVSWRSTPGACLHDDCGNALNDSNVLGRIPADVACFDAKPDPQRGGPKQPDRLYSQLATVKNAFGRPSYAVHLTSDTSSSSH